MYRYLIDMANKQTFRTDKAGNKVVDGTGHAFAKVKFGEFTTEAYDAWKANGGKK